jgi:hypothetical protein
MAHWIKDLGPIIAAGVALAIATDPRIRVESCSVGA